MQQITKDYDPKNHVMFRALTIKQPFADKIKSGEKRIEVRSWNTNYRGLVFITSSKKPFLEGRCGIAICIVELYDVVKITDLTAQEVSQTCLSPEELEEYGGYGWLLRKPVNIPQIPIRGNLGIWKLYLEKGDLSFPEKTDRQVGKYEEILEDDFIKEVAETTSLAKLIMYLTFLSMVGIVAVGVALWLIKNIDNIMNWLTLT